VTDAEDRKEALGWDVEILVNNAGVGEGDSTLDIPAANILRQFEVNVIGPLLLTQRIAKQMIKRGEGRIVWVSRREGLNAIARRWAVHRRLQFHADIPGHVRHVAARMA
jgi:short-subunit dehydrogenase